MPEVKSEATSLEADERNSAPLKPDGSLVDDGKAADQHFEQERPIKGFRWALVVISVLSSISLYAIDNTIVADIQPNIVETLGEIEKLPWLPVAFLVACVSTNSLWGRIYGQLNAKWLYLLCVLLFEVGSAVCGAAPSMNVLIGGRVLAGLGGSGIYIGVMTLVSVNTSTQERPMYIGMTGLTWGLGTVLGPIVGGAFAVSKVGWRFSFYINLFFAAVACPVYLFMIPSFDPQPGVPLKQRLSQLDYVGTVLMTGGSIAGVMAINFGGQIYPWDSGPTIACFVVSGVLFIAFGIQQWYCILTTEDSRTFPCQFLQRPSFIVLFVQTAAVSTIFFVPIYFIPLFLQFVKGYSAISAGVRLLPLVVAVVVAIILNGVLMSKLGHYMPWYLAGGCLSLIGSVLMMTVDSGTSTAKTLGYSVLLGTGGGMYAQASFAVAQAKAKPREIPIASGFIALAQLAGGTIALAIANSVFSGRATSGIQHIVPNASSDQVRSALSGVGSTFIDSLDASTRSAVLKAISIAIGRVYILAIAASVLSILLAIFMPREKLFVAAKKSDTLNSVRISHAQ